jgi:hypothetical protein
MAFLNVTVLRRSRDDEPCVEDVEVVTDGSRHRVLPRRDHSLEGSLDVRLAAFLRARLRNVTCDTMLFHEPEAELRLPAVVLSNLQTIATVLRDGRRKIVFRFSQIVGRAQSALRASAEGLRSAIQQVAVGAYDDVLRQAVALTQTAGRLDAGPEADAAFRAGRAHLRRDMEALALQVDLLALHVERRAAAGPVEEPAPVLRERVPARRLPAALAGPVG